MIEVFRNALFAKCLGGTLCRILLVVEIQAASHRVMGVVHLGDDIRDRELQLDQVEVGSRIAGTQIVLVG